MLNTYPQTPAHNHLDMSNELYEQVNKEEKNKFVCNFSNCGKIFRYKSEFVRHTATHSESRPFICQYDNCHKAFKRNDALENHIRSSHTKETPFVCPVADCGAKFTTHGSFRYHVIKHNKQDHEIPEQHTEEESTYKQIKLAPSINNPFAYNGKVLKTESEVQHLVEKAMTAEFYAPAPRFASSIKWEMVDDEAEHEEESQEISKEEKVPDLASENQLLKEKLNASEKTIETMQRKMNEMMNELVMYRSQLDFGSFGNYNQQAQTTSSDFTQKEEPTEETAGLPVFIAQNNLIDFLSFSQDMANFDF